MKVNFGILTVMTLLCPSGQIARGIPVADTDTQQSSATSAEQNLRTLDSLIAGLDTLSRFQADICYEISLAMTDEDVVYDLSVASSANNADSHFGANYLIDWQTDRNGEHYRGFTAYFDGHCYRYRDHRLQEYHYQWDSIPFITADGGVQRNGQFVDLLPASIARELKKMRDSDDFELTYKPSAQFGGKEVCVITAAQNVQGYTGRNFRLITDRQSGLPLLMENEYNPAQISEQSVRAKYTYAPSAQTTAVSDEEQLMSLYPEIFENFRESNYRIENIRGLPIPGFSLPTPTAERYTYAKGETFKAPTVMAILSADNSAAAPTIGALREAINSMPRDIDLILVFTGSHIDSIEEVAGPQLHEGETVLMSGKPLARDCGTTVFPTILIIDRNGIVTDVELGYNKSLAQDVIQSLALLK